MNLSMINNKMNNKKSGLTNQGFTLVELMVVVGIIGVLASVAIPQYSRFTARAKQSEVKVMLGTARTAIEAYRPENGLTTCLNVAGYQQPTSTFYAAGFGGAASGSVCGANGTSACGTASATCVLTFAATKSDGGGAATGAGAVGNGNLSSATAYTVGAAGVVRAAGGTDTWTINQDGGFVNVASGI